MDYLFTLVFFSFDLWCTKHMLPRKVSQGELIGKLCNISTHNIAEVPVIINADVNIGK